MTILTIILALLLFSFIVFIHELGHFLFAKLGGVKVHEFSIGMGPKIYSIKKKTEYSVRLLPIGGFVSMEGEDESSNDPNAFGNKSIFKRFCTLVAGPLFNIILAVLLLVPVFLSIGVPSDRSIIGELSKSAPAIKAGFKTGDVIERINGIKINSWEDTLKTVNGSGGKRLTFDLDRNGKDVKISVTPMEKDGTYIVGIQQKLEKNILKAIPYAAKTTWSISMQMFKFIGQMITRSVPGGFSNSVAGPVGVISMVSSAAKVSFVNFIYLGSIISLNLGIFNLLPFPALDGWRILMTIIEAIRGGKKFDATKEGFVNLVGFGTLMVFMLFITYKDIIRLLAK